MRTVEASPPPPRRSADPVLIETSATRGLIAPPTVHHAERGVVFVNFDGATLEYGQDDARSNRTVLQELAGDFPAYGGGSGPAAALQAVIADFAAYDVVIVDQRPSSGNYTMAMVGPHDAGTVLGIAPLDCYDGAPNNVVFAFHGADDGYSAASQANTISQEIAHSFGLEHVDHGGDIMYPVSAGGDPSFLDECLPIVPAPDIACVDQHADHCPAGQQNAHRELLQRFGPVAPAEPSTDTIAVVAPDDGAEFEVGEPFDIVAQSIDGRAFSNVVLFVDEANIGGRTASPYTWAVDGLTEGVYQAYVIGIDGAGTMWRSESIEMFVGVDNPARDDGGGGCRLAGRATASGSGAHPTAWAALGLLAFGLIRRRR